MNMNLLLWVYLINTMILIVHEIDSAYWQEWKLLGDNSPNSINPFLILHFPMIFIMLFGIILLKDNNFWGLITSFLVSFGGLFAFFFHFYHIRKGRQEFNTLLSKSIIISTFIISIFQIIITIRILA